MNEWIKTKILSLIGIWETNLEWKNGPKEERRVLQQENTGWRKPNNKMGTNLH